MFSVMQKVCYSVSAMLLISVLAEPLSAKDGLAVGRINSVNKKTKEIIINTDTGKSLKLGDKIYVRIEEQPVIMKVTFPMMTTSKCRPEKKYEKQIGSISKGLTVFMYEAGIESADNENKSNPLVGSWEYTVRSPEARGGEDGTITFKANGTYIDTVKNSADGPAGQKTSGKYMVDPENGVLEFIGKESSTVYNLIEKGEDYLLFEIYDKNAGMHFRYTIYCKNTADFKIKTQPVVEPQPQ